MKTFQVFALSQLNDLVNDFAETFTLISSSVVKHGKWQTSSTKLLELLPALVCLFEEVPTLQFEVNQIPNLLDYNFWLILCGQYKYMWTPRPTTLPLAAHAHVRCILKPKSHSDRSISCGKVVSF